ncbi:hypothetical protein CBS101457_002583 [Exobasidium rhododendri]|nr:hypothetical protein CBS101457_002583 [Exobasidium rhododendri]
MAVVWSTASTARLLRATTLLPLASTSRLFTTSAPTYGKSPPGKGKNAIKKAKREARMSKAIAAGQTEKRVVQTMKLDEAVKIFQAVEVTRPLNAYELHIVTTVSSHQANALRGRLALPKEARIRSERLLIFAESGSPASNAVKALQENSVTLQNNVVMGGSEMIQDVVDGKGAAGGNFTKVLSTQGLLPQVARSLARSLGPKGLMPNVKRGTVVNTADEMDTAIREAQGAINWRGDRSGVVRGAVGRINFTAPELRSNISAFLQAIVDKVGSGLASGSAQAGIFAPSGQTGEMDPQAIKRARSIIKQVHLSSTQGPAVLISLPEVL